MSEGPAENWLALGRVDEIAPKTAKHFDTPVGGVGIFHMADGRLFAIEDRCPHAYALLSFGLMDQAKDTVLCPLHGWRIGLADGQIQFPAQTGMSVCTFPVRVSAGLIEVNIAGCAKAPNSGDGAAAANSLN